MLISYNWLKSYIPEIPDVDKLTEVITFNLCEIESVEKLPNGDTVFDLKILPDRAHDLLSHRGVAYEIAGLMGIQVWENSQFNYSKEVLKSNLKVEIQTPKCRRYMGRIIRGVKIGPSPKWISDYLESVGQRSINNIVDATNMVLLGIGQPIHSFDLRKLDSEKIVVRMAKEGDTLSLVGSEKLEAKPRETDMMITDGVKNLAIAGIKGGLDSGISDDTTDILIEVASFDAVSVRKTARRLGIQTDASKRYENDLSSELCDLAMKEISSFVLAMNEDAEIEEIVDIYDKKQEERSISFTTEYIGKTLGVEIKDEDIKKILENYEREFSFNDGIFTMKVPVLRLDITGAHDMVEDIGRAYGYEKIEGKLPELDFNKKDNDTWTKICLAKSKLINDGYNEVMTYALVDKGEVEILASLSDKNFLRTNLLDGLTKSYELNRLNAPLLGISEVKIFEVGTIFTNKGEEIHVAYMDKKNKLEITLDSFISTSIDAEVLPVVTGVPTFKSWSLYPFIYRDIACWVPEGTESNKLFEIYKELGGDLLVKDPVLVDKFQKGDKISYAYRLVFQSYEKTLKDEEINEIIEKINTKISSLGFEIR